MKKLSLLLALVLICSSLSGVVSLADSRGAYTVTFFTNDEYLLIGKERSDVHYDTVVMRFDHGHVITRQDLPYYEILIHGFDSEPTRAWVEDPLGYTVEEDTAFEMYIANKPEEMAAVRFFGASLELPGGSNDAYSDCIIGYPVGHVLTERDLPQRPVPPPGGDGFPYRRLKWTPDPVGVTVYGGEEFESYYEDILSVEFLDPHHSPCNPDQVIKEYYDIEYGTIVEPPTEDEIPQYPGEVFVGWDSDEYLYEITRALRIYAEYRYLGDANIDSVVNSGDAAYILRYALNLFQAPNDIDNFDKLADYNCDGQVNTGDAAGVLAYAVNG